MQSITWPAFLATQAINYEIAIARGDFSVFVVGCDESFCLKCFQYDGDSFDDIPKLP